MSVSNELFKLCKQVYEATGWENTPNAYYVEGHYFSGNIEMPEGEPYLAQDSGKYDLAFPTKWVCPLYTSDYLLEKLPHTLSDNDGDRYTITVHKVGDSWLANYTLDNVGMHHIYADTPLKALLKLTIKLHQENIL